MVVCRCSLMMSSALGRRRTSVVGIRHDDVKQDVEQRRVQEAKSSAGFEASEEGEREEERATKINTSLAGPLRRHGRESGENLLSPSLEGSACWPSYGTAPCSLVGWARGVHRQRLRVRQTCRHQRGWNPRVYRALLQVLPQWPSGGSRVALRKVTRDSRKEALRTILTGSVSRAYA